MPGAAVQHLSSARCVRATRLVQRSWAGIRTFTGWEGPILTDSGGFQVFSLAKLRNIQRGGRAASPPMWTGAGFSWGRRRACGSSPTSAPPSPWPLTSACRTRRQYDYAQALLRPHRTVAAALQDGDDRLNAAAGHASIPHQMLFGINQGCTYDGSARRAHEADRGAGPGRLCDRRPGRGRTRRGDVPHHRGSGAAHAEGQDRAT